MGSALGEQAIVNGGKGAWGVCMVGGSVLNGTRTYAVVLYVDQRSSEVAYSVLRGER